MHARYAIVLPLLFTTSCAHEATGGALLLNAQPSPPTFAGAYDFDLQPMTHYTACVRREGRLDFPGVSYWVLGVAFDRMPGDALTREAIAAAASHMVDLADADTLVMTRVVAESKGPDEICATVYAHGIVLKKARSAEDGRMPAEESSQPKTKPPED